MPNIDYNVSNTLIETDGKARGKRRTYPSHGPAVSKYDKKSYDKLLLRFRKDGAGERSYSITKEMLMEASERSGMSANEYVMHALNESFLHAKNCINMSPSVTDECNEELKIAIGRILGPSTDWVLFAREDAQAIGNALSECALNSDNPDDFNATEYIVAALKEKAAKDK